MLCLSSVMQQVPQKHRYLSTKLHDVTSKKNCSDNLEMEPADCSGMLVCIYQSTLLHISEYLSLNISHCGTFSVLTMLDIKIILQHQQQFCKKFVFSRWNVMLWIFILCWRGVAQQILIVLHFSQKMVAKAAKLLPFLLLGGEDHLVASILA